MHKFGFFTASAIIIANMIGTGVFTSLGFQLSDFKSPSTIVLLWTLGGIASCSGALCYGELARQYPKSGGEYAFISKTLHPSLGFVAGWISATVGFSAPTALVAITFATYLHSVFAQIPITLTAISLILLLSIAHTRSRKYSGTTQSAFTLIKILLIGLFIMMAFFFMQDGHLDFTQAATSNEKSILSTEFGIALIYVTYAYTGWNAATYITEEVKNPSRVIPLALIFSTMFVTVAYVLLNLSFLSLAPIDALVGRIDVAYAAVQYALGNDAAKYLGVFFSILLISTASAMTMAGPRVLYAMGRDYSPLKFLGEKNLNRIPSRAIWLQSTVAIGFILTSSFEHILIFSGSALALSSVVTICGLIKLLIYSKTRRWLYLPALSYLIIVGGTLAYLIAGATKELIATAGLVVSGLIVYRFSQKKSPVLTRE